MAHIENIPWSHNNSDLIWKLITQLQHPSNFKTLFGTSPGENTSGDTKVAVYKRIAAALFPQYFPELPTGAQPDKTVQKNQTTITKRVKARAEELQKTYKKHAARLRLTGSGIGATADGEQGLHEGEESQTTNVYMEYYVPATGPGSETPQLIKNIWQEILAEFPFFSELHKFMSGRPNVVPIAVTTGVGPGGRQTIHMQPTGSVANQDSTTGMDTTQPSTFNEREAPTASGDGSMAATPGVPATPVEPSADRTFGQDQLNTPTARCPPKPSSFHISQERLEQVKATIKPVSKKRSFEDTVLDISKTNMKANIASREADAIRSDLARLDGQRHLKLTEFKEGLIDRDEYRAKMKHYDREEAALKEDLSRFQRKRARLASPDWDENLRSDAESV